MRRGSGACDRPTTPPPPLLLPHHPCSLPSPSVLTQTLPQTNQCRQPIFIAGRPIVVVVSFSPPRTGTRGSSARASVDHTARQDTSPPALALSLSLSLARRPACRFPIGARGDHARALGRAAVGRGPARARPCVVVARGAWRWWYLCIVVLLPPHARAASRGPCTRPPVARGVASARGGGRTSIGARRPGLGISSISSRRRRRRRSPASVGVERRRGARPAAVVVVVASAAKQQAQQQQHDHHVARGGPRGGTRGV